MSEKRSTTLPATVEKIIKPIAPGEPEKAQISIEGADHLYKEIRIENQASMTSPKRPQGAQRERVEKE
jgi:hypothetical protein